jgi:prepilin-type processing-associated H-X9-DG protein
LSSLLRDPGAFPDVETNAMLYSASYAGCHSSHGGGGLEVIAFGCKKSPMSVALANGCITTQTDLTLALVTDGLSHTMVVAEKSLTTRIRAFAGETNPPMNCAWMIGTDVANQFVAEFGPNVFKRIVDYGTWTESASSQHPGGVNVLMGDGSVRFVKNSIDATNKAEQPFGVWQRLATRNGGEAIDAGAF